eukprot:3388209-Alexandrium_andersonii.AAC.1
MRTTAPRARETSACRTIPPSCRLGSRRPPQLANWPPALPPTSMRSVGWTVFGPLAQACRYCHVAARGICTVDGRASNMFKSDLPPGQTTNDPSLLLSLARTTDRNSDAGYT